MITVAPAWRLALQWGVWFVVMSLAMGWVARSRTNRRVPGDGRTLVHPRSTLIVGVVCTVFFLALAVLSVMFPGKSQRVWIATLLFVGFAALGVPMILDYLNGRHTLTPDGLRFGKMLGGGGELRWNEVTALHYSESAKWFRLELGDGRVVRVSAMLIGLPEFASAALAEVPPAAIDPGARTVLEATAAGDLPRIWG